MRGAVTVVGGSLAALASVERLAAGGCPVRWCRPTKGVGGGFAPLVVDGHRLDLGARLFELVDGPRVQPDVAEQYHPGPTGFVPWWPAVTAYLLELLGEEPLRIAAAEQYAFGGWCDDAYVRVRLDGVARRLPAPMRERMAREAAAIAGTVAHPAGILARPDGELASTTLARASLEQHGAAFHDALIAPLAAKLFPAGTEGPSALLRRRAWLPLFWPRTVAAELGGQSVADAAPTYRPDRHFHVDRHGGTGSLIASLLRRIDASPVVETVGYERVGAIDADGIDLVVPGGRRRVDGPCIVGAGPEETLAAAGIDYRPERTRVAVWWLAVDERDLLRRPPSMGFVTDADIVPYRVGSTLAEADDRGRVVVTVEAGDHCADGDVTGPEGGVLARLGLARPGAAIDVVHRMRAAAFVAPTVLEHERLRFALDELHERGLPHVAVGGLTGFAADSINEQLCQALLVAEGRLAVPSPG